MGNFNCKFIAKNRSPIIISLSSLSFKKVIGLSILSKSLGFSAIYIYSLCQTGAPLAYLALGVILGTGIFETIGTVILTKNAVEYAHKKLTDVFEEPIVLRMDADDFLFGNMPHKK